MPRNDNLVSVIPANYLIELEYRCLVALIYMPIFKIAFGRYITECLRSFELYWRLNMFTWHRIAKPGHLAKIGQQMARRWRRCQCRLGITCPATAI